MVLHAPCALTSFLWETGDALYEQPKVLPVAVFGLVQRLDSVG